MEMIVDWKSTKILLSYTVESEFTWGKLSILWAKKLWTKLKL